MEVVILQLQIGPLEEQPHGLADIQGAATAKSHHCIAASLSIRLGRANDIRFCLIRIHGENRFLILPERAPPNVSERVWKAFVGSSPGSVTTDGQLSPSPPGAWAVPKSYPPQTPFPLGMRMLNNLRS